MNFVKIASWVFVSALLFLGACATTMKTGTWKDESFNGKIHEVLIIGLGENATKRRMFETTMVKAFD